MTEGGVGASGSGELERLVALLAPGGFMFRDAHYLVAELELDRDAARRFVPSSLTIPEPARASIFLAWFPHTSFGSVYREAGVFLHLEHRGRSIVHCPWMIVDDDVAMTFGRDVLGYPKKLGSIELAIEGERIRGRAERRGALLVCMDGTLGERIEDPPPMLGRPHRNIRSHLGLSLPVLLAFCPREHALEVRRADLAIEIGGSDHDPLNELGLGAVRTARLHRVNLAAGGVPVPCALLSPLDHLRLWRLRMF